MDTGHAHLPELADSVAADLLAAEGDTARVVRLGAGNCGGQLGLPAALHAGDAHHLSGPDTEADAVNVPLAIVAHDDKVGHQKQVFSRFRVVLLEAKLHIPADHQVGDTFLGHFADVICAQAFSLPQDGHPVT